MNQLEMIAQYNRQSIFNKLYSENAIYLGDLYVYYNEMYCTIYNLNAPNKVKVAIIEPYSVTIDKVYLLDYIHCNFFVKNTVSIIGCHDIILCNGYKNQQTTQHYNRLQENLLYIQDEYIEFITYLNSNIDNIILNGGKMQ